MKNRARKNKIIFLLIIFFITVYLGMDILVPIYVEKQIKRELTSYFDDYQSIEVEINTFPPWELLFSRSDTVKIKADLLNYEGLKLRDVSAYYQDIIIDNGEIIGENTDLYILITENDLNEYIEEKYTSLENFDIYLEKNNAYMEGYINFFNNEVNLEVNGSFDIEESDEILFIPGDVRVEEITISREILNEFIRDSGYAFDLSQLNIPIKVENILLNNDRLYLISGIYAERAGVNEE